MKHLWNGSSAINTASRTYATYANAVKAAEKLNYSDASFVIAATPEGRFFVVAIGQKALDDGLHHSGIAHCAM